MSNRAILVGVVLAVGVVVSAAAESPKVAPDALRDAIQRALPPIEEASRGSAEHRTCFTCHNQALPIMAVAEAKARGFDVNEENLERQIQHTAEHLQRGQQGYLEGRGQGGRVMTAGYALWALEAGGYPPDETTAAVTGFLVDHQKELKHWRLMGNRPPSSGSDFTATYVALRGLQQFASDQQQEAIQQRMDQVRQWLQEETPQDTEDHVFLLRSLRYVGGESAMQSVTDQLLQLQREDGGWAQNDEMESDAYATATVLVALLRGDVDPDEPVIQRGVQFLLTSQLADGTWHVVTRAEPFQTYFETGFPHGKDQFISTAASSWATIALVLALPDDD